MKNELLKPGDIIEIKDNLENEKYICIVTNIDDAYRLISPNDGYDFMVEEDGHDFRGYTRGDLEKYLTDRDWEVIKYYRGLEEFLIHTPPKMTREKMIESLKEIRNITLNSKQVEDVLPEMYEYFVHVLRFMEKELKDFQKGKYLVNICFLPDHVTYTVGKDAQQLANEPHWVEDRWEYIETDELEKFIAVAN